MKAKLLPLLSAVGGFLLGQSPLPEMGAEPESRLGASELFELHSAFWPSLHDRLYEISQSEAPEPELCEVPTPAAAGWSEAVAQYRAEMASRHHRTDDLMWDIRVFLAGFRPVADKPEVSRQLEILRRAAPAYAVCFWAEQQVASRHWAEDILPRLEQYELRLRDRLTGYFRHPWPSEPLRVDVLHYASWAGANTIIDPNHVQISSRNPGYREWSGLEMIFHESSHILVDGRSTPVGKLIVEASRRRNADPPFNLWHALLFYTVGETVADELEKTGHSGYEPYVYRQGLFRRTWGDYQKPLEDHFHPYLEGRRGLEEAVDMVVAAVIEKTGRR